MHWPSMAKKNSFLSLILVLGSIFLWLGFWQIDRLDWKRNLIDQQQNQQSSPAVPLFQAMSKKNSPSLYQRKFIGNNTINQQDCLFVQKPRPSGLQDPSPKGFDLYCLLKTTAEQFAIVRFGWISSLSLHTFTLPNNIKYQFIVTPKPPHPKNWWDAKSQIEKNVLSSFDLDLMSQQWDIKKPQHYFSVNEISPTLPKEVHLYKPVIKLPNNHLEYAFTWFTLCGLVFFLGFLYYRRS